MGMHGNHKLEIEVDDEEERSDLEICSEEQLDLEDSSPQRAGDFDDFDDQSSEKKYDLETISPNIQLSNIYKQQKLAQSNPFGEIIQNTLGKKEMHFEHSLSVFQQADDEVNTIINAVTQRRMKQDLMGKSELKSKVAEINHKLIKQNANMLHQINKLEKEVAKLTTSIRKNQTNNSYTAVLEKSRARLHKAELMNSRLSSRLIEEKQKSLNISEAFRSLLKREPGSLAQSKFSINKKSPETSNGVNKVCSKCNGLDNSSKNPQASPSPVLQFNSYLISQQKSPMQVEQFVLAAKKPTRNVQCYVSMDETEQLKQLSQLVTEEGELQKQIEQNNKDIQHYEYELQRIIEL